MPRFLVTFGIRGGLPPMPNTQTITLANGAEFFREDNTWRVRVAVTNQDQNQVEEQARQAANASLALLHAFLSNTVTGFHMSIDGSAPIIQNAATGETIHQFRGTLGTSLTLSVIVAGALDSSIASLNTALGPVQEEDCRIILHFAATAMREDDNLYRFLNWITVVEAMLSEQGETTEKVCRRLSVLVSSFPGLRDMQGTYDRFKTAYNARSDILHGREIPAVTRADVDSVSSLASAAVRNYFLLRRTLNQADIKLKLDRFFDQGKIAEIRRLTAL